MDRHLSNIDFGDDKSTQVLLKKIHNTNIISIIDEHISGMSLNKLDEYVDDIIEYWYKYKKIHNDLEIYFMEAKKQIQTFMRSLDKKYKFPKKIRHSTIIYILRIRFQKDILSASNLYQLLDLLTTKNRFHSGVLEIAIMTGPGEFSCKYDCYYCPNQSGIARSYIKEEPAVRRAAQNGFDCVRQITTRITSYQAIGQPGDKGEFIILGGTFSNYSEEYRYTFMRDLYYACNTYYDETKRTRLTLEEEKHINSTDALFKVIGLTVETRPDCINIEELKRYISYGVTRVQIGVQHTNDRLLKKVNRGCYTKDTIQALYLLKNAGFKVLCHYMPNLPGATPEDDIEMFTKVIYNPNLICDEWKIYPTSVTTTSSKDIEDIVTVIEQWYKTGKYKPYPFSDLLNVVRYAKENIPRYIRISRIFRDIPVENIVGGARVPHMRQIVQDKMAEKGVYCECIRCREIKNRKIELNSLVYDIEKYIAQSGTEYFISANYYPSNEQVEGYNQTDRLKINNLKSYIVGFCRLRISSKDDYTLPNLCGCSLVRELHVYGKMVPSYLSKYMSSNTQHRGIGSKLMKIAEKISLDNDKHKIAVISGVGVRGFYKKKLGYVLEDNYMVKQLYPIKHTYMPLFNAKLNYIYEIMLIVYIVGIIVYYII